MAGVEAGLTARLEPRGGQPVVLALSGGGDSLALLHVAAGWAKTHGRGLLAVTVDHGLSPDSPGWSAFAEQAAHSVGADWRGVVWTDTKPAGGLPAAARMARHRLIADASRAAGARVVLFAHTADDIAEGEVMRAEGSTLGRLRDWTPSPAWPEGRGLMLLRPMLGARRGEIRDWLAARGLNWIDDPANEDVRFARSRARATLLPDREGAKHTPDAAPVSRKTRGGAPVRSIPLSTGEGWFRADRSLDGSTLAAALVCAGGGDRLPRGQRLDALLARLRSGETFVGVVCGARVATDGDQILVSREAGEFARRRIAPQPLSARVEVVWDGRWAITADVPGWSVVPAAGRIAALAGTDRAVLKRMPSAVRGAHPVLIRNDGTAPVLAGAVAKARSLVEERLALALDRMTHERDLGTATHGGSLRNPLFSTLTSSNDGARRRFKGMRRE